MTIGTSRAIAGGALVLLVALGGFLYYSKRQGGFSSITNFDMCKAAGYQVVQGDGKTTRDSCSTPDGQVFISTAPLTPGPVTTASTSMENMIRVNDVLPNQVVKSPLTITGKAVGNWYFEASFPVELVDGNGKSIMIKPAQAQGEWMTTDFVPFTITLSFAKPATATGTLILRNDNPSGLPENQKEVRIPVRFSE
jgi:hypothetical protein